VQKGAENCKAFRFLRRRDFKREICSWPFADLSHVVESEADKDVPYFP
jgi:hypothetical protein